MCFTFADQLEYLSMSPCTIVLLEGFLSSWTKRPVEVDSPQPMSPWDKLADPPDSTCAQVIHSRPEEFSNNWIPLAQAAEFPGLDDELENVPMGKDLEIGVPRDPNLLLVDQSKVFVHSTVAHKDKTLELDLERDSENQKGRKLEPNMEKNFELGILAVDLMSTMTKNTDHRAENQAPENQKGLSKISDIKSSSAYDKNEIPSLKLSLNRLRDGHTGNRNLDHNILRHSDLSAFSRYNTASTTNQAPTGNVGSCSPLDNSSEAAKTESMHNLQSSSNGTPNQRSNGSSNNNDMGSSTNNVFAKPGLSNERPVSKPAIKCLQPSAFQPVQNGHVSSSQSLVPGKADTVTTNTGMAQPRGKNQQLKPQHHHHHYHHHHHSLYNLQQQQQQLAEHDELSLENMAAVATQCGSSNILSTGIEGNAGCYSLNGSNSGSNHGSNGQNCNAAVNAGPNMENDNLAAVKDGPSGGRSGVDQSCFSQREAGLNKFRQKRKERCFEKKVRYHSRKRMAEQRPRVRGQFVRQAAQQTRSKDADC
ncbi:CCT domain [Dillenia turbinata]|uniref:CCT domain n=1 Tax=Dillenia turbinata TaxID=194707 RepID=A0AAN8ZBQ1_9MAGN